MSSPQKYVVLNFQILETCNDQYSAYLKIQSFDNLQKSDPLPILLSLFNKLFLFLLLTMCPCSNSLFQNTRNYKSQVIPFGLKYTTITMMFETELNKTYKEQTWMSPYGIFQRSWHIFSNR